MNDTDVILIIIVRNVLIVLNEAIEPGRHLENEMDQMPVWHLAHYST